MQSKIETISLGALHDVQVALTTLIGCDIYLSLQSAQLQRKDAFLDQQQGSNTFIGLEFKGSYQGDGCLAISTSCGIKMSGKMLMLSPVEINQGLAEGDLEEETEFAFEDITRAIIAAYVKSFQTPGTIISSITYKSKQTVTGVPEADEVDFLREAQPYYQVSADLSMDGSVIGTFSLLLPAFLLLYSTYLTDDVVSSLNLPGAEERGESEAARDANRVKSGLEFKGLTQKDSETDALFGSTLVHAASELSNLLEVFVSIERKSQGFIDGEHVFHCVQKNAHLATRFSLTGVVDEKVLFIVEPDSGVWLGALLAEGVHGAVLTRLQEASLDADRQDGFAEICGILMDYIISAIRSEGALEIEVGQKKVVLQDFDNTEVVEPGDVAGKQFHITEFRMTAGALGSAELHLLIPKTVIDLLLTDDNEVSEPTKMESNSTPLQTDGPIETISAGKEQSVRLSAPDVLIIDSESADGRVIQSQLAGELVSSDLVRSTSEVDRSMLVSYSAIILVVSGLHEKALGISIQVNAACSVPLIVAAPRWTHSEVLKAVRYGVSDILVTPTQPGEVAEKLKDLAVGAFS